MLVLKNSEVVITLTAAEVKALLVVLRAGAQELNTIVVGAPPATLEDRKRIQVALGIGNNLQMKLERRRRGKQQL